VIHYGTIPDKNKKRGVCIQVFERSGGVKFEPNRHLILLWRVYLLPTYHVEKTKR